MGNFFNARIKVYRPRTPFFLRPEVWLVLAGLGYFTYEKVNFYGPLAYEQNFPRGAVRGLSSELERFLNEQEVGPQTWALPINDYRRSLGQCFGLIPGKDDPTKTTQGGPVAFSSVLPNAPGEAVKEITYVCQQDKADKFFVTVKGRGLTRLERAYDLPLALEVEEGETLLRTLPGAQVELLLPNGVLGLRSEAGFEATVRREEGILNFVVTKGLVEADPRFTTNFRAEGLGLRLSAEGKGQLRLPNRRPVGEGKIFTAVPSGIYAQTK